MRICMLDQIKQWIKRDGLDGPSQRIDLVYKRNYLFSILRENMTLQEIGRLFNRRHSLVIHGTVSYTHLRAHETGRNLVCRLLLEKKKKKKK